MEQRKEVKIEEVKTRANFYDITGNLLNGGHLDENNVWQPYIYKHSITRRIIAINLEKKILYCECGRQFIIDEQLKLYECNH